MLSSPPRSLAKSTRERQACSGLFRQTISMMLEKLGCTVETAINGSEAVDKCSAALKQGKPFDLTIMDLTIPGGMGGNEAIGELLAIDPSAKVIVSSGYSSDPVIANYSQYGFSGRLTKPFTFQDLYKTLSRVFNETV